MLVRARALNEVEERATAPRPSRPAWNVGSLGATFRRRRAGHVGFRRRPQARGPAARAGLLAGDRLVARLGTRGGDTRPRHATPSPAPAAGAKVVLDVARCRREARKVECVTSAEPRLPAMAVMMPAASCGPRGLPVDAAAGAGRRRRAGQPREPALNVRAGTAAASTPGAGSVRPRPVRFGGSRGLRRRDRRSRRKGKRAEAIEAFGQARTGGAASGDAALAAQRATDSPISVSRRTDDLLLVHVRIARERDRAQRLDSSFRGGSRRGTRTRRSDRERIRDPRRACR